MALSDPPAFLPESSRRRRAADTTPFAVALEYRWPQTDSPTVTATGRGDVARRIVDVARDSGVPVRRDADLVEVLRVLDLGERIPLEAFAAVAEILAYLYRLNSGMAASAHVPEEYAR